MGTLRNVGGRGVVGGGADFGFLFEQVAKIEGVGRESRLKGEQLTVKTSILEDSQMHNNQVHAEQPAGSKLQGLWWRCMGEVVLSPLCCHIPVATSFCITLPPTGLAGETGQPDGSGKECHRGPGGADGAH